MDKIITQDLLKISHDYIKGLSFNHHDNEEKNMKLVIKVVQLYKLSNWNRN